MHISEGVLSAPVLLSGAAIAAVGTAVGVKRLDYDRIPQAAILSAAFFVASLVRVPVGPSSIHLILNGLVGLLLGWVAFPAILVGLILQVLLFQFGGFTTLGVNAVIMGMPAVVSFYTFRSGVRSQKSAVALVASFLCGAGAVFLGALMVGIALFLTGEQFLAVSEVVVIAHVPVMVIEGLITAFCVKFFKRVEPEILEGVYGH
jgi:cobalt/nickel transport system permease protein